MYARLLFMLAAAASVTLPALAKTSEAEPRPYHAERNASHDVDAALLKARAQGRRTLIVMGANWCHDSRSLAARFEQPRFQGLILNHFEVVYVDAGLNKERNTHIAQRYGIHEIVGTPTLMIISEGGHILNKNTAPTWRNAHDRGDDEIYSYLETYAQGVVIEAD